MSLPDATKRPEDFEKQISPFDEKEVLKQTEIESVHESDGDFGVLESERDIAMHIVSLHDDPTLNPWTIRAFVLGLGLSAFGGVLGKSFTSLHLLSAVET